MSNAPVWPLTLRYWNPNAGHDSQEVEQIPVGRYAVVAASSENDEEYYCEQLVGTAGTLDEVVELIRLAHGSGAYASRDTIPALQRVQEPVADHDDFANECTGYDVYLDGTHLHSWVDVWFVQNRRGVVEYEASMTS